MALLVEVAVREASRCTHELFVYTDRRDWYERRGWSLVHGDPDARSVVLRRSTRGNPTGFYCGEA